MPTRDFFRPARLWSALLALALAGATAQAQLVATPSSVVFERVNQTHTISLTYNGQPVPASAIKGHKIYIDKHDYDEFFNYNIADGQISLTTNERTETSSYAFVISTTHGPVRVDVYTPLTERPDSIESQAQQLGITVDELKTRLGLVTTAPRENVTLNLPPVYYEGQTLSFTMPATEGRTYTWRINGEVVAQGPTANTINYTFPRAGNYVVEYTESVGGGIVASASASTSVAPLPEQPRLVRTGTAVVLHAPEGYERYVWKVGDQVIVEGRDFNHAFTAPGEHVVILESERPLIEGLTPTRVTRYRVVVE